MNWQDDPQVQITRVKSIGEEPDGWSIGREDGWSFFVPRAAGVVPRVGMEARFYGEGVGAIVRGLVLDGQVVFYRTEDEENIDAARRVREHELKKIADFEEKRAEYDAQYAALPPEFQRRLDGFRHRNRDFRWRHEPYELFACMEAVKIARALGSVDAVRLFAKAPWEEQKKMVPTISPDHSGNTFEVACGLAALSMDHPERVEQAHGALCPLLGCEEYGCWAANAPRVGGA